MTPLYIDVSRNLNTENCVGQFYLENEYWLAVFQLVFAMLGMGAALTLDDFNDVIRERKAVIVGIAIQLLLVPTIAFLFIQLLGLPTGVAIGIAIIAAIPGGSTSNIFTLFARGNIALSISITGLTTLACLVTTPLVLSFLMSSESGTLFEMPRAQVMRDILYTLMIPLALGMIYRRAFPRSADAISVWAIRASIFGLALIVIGSISSGRLDAEMMGTANIIAVTLFAVLLGVAGWLTCIIMRVSPADRSAICMEAVVRNINLGLLIKASLFPIVANQVDEVGDMVLLTLLLFGGLQMLIAGLIILYRRVVTRKLA